MDYILRINSKLLNFDLITVTLLRLIIFKIIDYQIILLNCPFSVNFWRKAALGSNRTNIIYFKSGSLGDDVALRNLWNQFFSDIS